MIEVLHAGPGQLVVLPIAARLRLTPAPFHKPVALEPVQDRIEHPVRPRELPAGELADALDDRVTVAIALTQDGEDERCGRGCDEVLVDFHSLYLEALYIA